MAAAAVFEGPRLATHSRHPHSPCLQLTAFYACLAAGVVPVLVRGPAGKASVPELLPALRAIVQQTRAAMILTTDRILKLLRGAAKDPRASLALFSAFLLLILWS